MIRVVRVPVSTINQVHASSLCTRRFTAHDGGRIRNLKEKEKHLTVVKGTEAQLHATIKQKAAAFHNS
jgi:hypothetical protein